MNLKRIVREILVGMVVLCSSVSVASAADTPVPQFGPIYFKFDMFSLTKAACAELDKVASVLLEHPELAVELIGHTVDPPQSEYAYALGGRMAESAMKYLVQKGVDAKHIEFYSVGKERPVTEWFTKKGRTLNRIVEIRIIPYTPREFSQ